MGIRVFISGNSGNKEVSEITSTTLRPRYSWVFQLWWDLLKVKFWYDFMAKIDYWRCCFSMAPRTEIGNSSTMRRRRGVLQAVVVSYQWLLAIFWETMRLSRTSCEFFEPKFRLNFSALRPLFSTIWFF